jgi:cytidine deaminase
VEFVVKCKAMYVMANSSIREFAPNVPVYMFSAKGDYEMMTLDQLMPKSFGPEDLPPVENLSH